MFIRNTGKETVKVALAADFLGNVPEVKNERGEAMKVEQVFATGSVALYRETLKPGEAVGFRHLGLGLGPNPAPGKENWIPFRAEPKAGHATLRHTHEIDIELADESKPGTRAKFTSGVIHFYIAPADEAKPPRDGMHRYVPNPRQKDVVIEQNYKDGQLHGPTRMFVRGELSQDQNYKEGKLDGFVRTYKKGKLVEEGFWKEGKIDGFKRLYEDGKLVGETFHKNGQPEGAAFVRSSTYKMNRQYLNGQPEGAWSSERVGQWKFTTNFKNGLLDGPWERKTIDGKVIRLTYDQGQLVDQGEDVKSFAFLKNLLRLAKDGDQLAKRVKDAIEADVDLDYPGVPTVEIVEDLQERFAIPMLVDSQLTDDAAIHKRKIVINHRQIPLGLGLHEMAASQELVFDYRFHVLWLTTPKAAAAWKDNTGVSDLKPADGSPLAKALTESPKFDLLATPIAKLAEPLQKEHNVTLDVSRASEAKWTRLSEPSSRVLRMLSLRDALSILLYQHNCRCREEGGKLIIEPLALPPKEKVEPAKENGAGLRINVPALGPAPVALDFAFPVNSEGTDQKQSFCFFFGVLR